MNRFVLIPVLGTAIATLAVALAGPTAPAWTALHLVTNGAAVVACALVISAFRPGEFLWWAWVVRSVQFVEPFALRAFGFTPASSPALLVGTTAFQNVVTVFAAALFTAAFVGSGLGLGSSPRAKGAVWIGGIVLCAAIGVPTLIHDLGSPFGPGYLVDLISLAGDVACFVAALPLLLIALELRGGALATTWCLLGASNLGWLLQDSVLTAGDRALWPSEALGTASVLAVAAAALAHRHAVRPGESPRAALA